MKKIQIFGILNEEFSSTFLKKFGQKMEFIDISGIQKAEILSIISTPNLKAIKFHNNSYWTIFTKIGRNHSKGIFLRIVGKVYVFM